MLFAVSISIAACEELKAGNANFDLGDGYKASFVLPDIGKALCSGGCIYCAHKYRTVYTLWLYNIL